jgi:hypothetical protein
MGLLETGEPGDWGVERERESATGPVPREGGRRAGVVGVDVDDGG